jgi:hypothetical protein
MASDNNAEWLQEPEQPNEVDVIIRVGKDADFPGLREAVDDLLKTIFDRSLEQLKSEEVIPSEISGKGVCPKLTIKPTCKPYSIGLCKIDAKCKIGCNLKK